MLNLNGTFIGFFNRYIEKTKSKNLKTYIIENPKILSKIKVKPSGKIGHVVLDNSLNVTHVAFVDEKITGVNWAKMINIDVGRHGAGVVLFGSNSDHINKMKTLTSALYKIGGP